MTVWHNFFNPLQTGTSTWLGYLLEVNQNIPDYLRPLIRGNSQRLHNSLPRWMAAGKTLSASGDRQPDLKLYPNLFKFSFVRNPIER